MRRVLETPRPAVEFKLHQNVPNPFNPSTLIRYELAAPSWVDLRVYDATGALVRVLVADDRPAGPNEAHWDGRNQYGARTASGVYFYRLKAAGFEMTRKMVLIE